MKNQAQLFLFFLFFLFYSPTIFAQANLGMTYQSVVRNSSNVLVANSAVGVKISILKTSPTGSLVFSETHSVTTNANGLATFIIGTGMPVSGDFYGIDWGSDSYFLKTETDPTGGNSYSIANTSQLLSVPYALYAEKSGNSWGITGNEGNTADFIGTTNDKDVTFKRNNAEKIRITNTGIAMSQEIKPNNVAGQNGQVLTSNGDGTMAWKNAAYNNNTRFSVRLLYSSPFSSGNANVNFIHYNYNATNVNLSTTPNTFIINKAGLYHFDIDINIPTANTSSNPVNYPNCTFNLSINGTDYPLNFGSFYPRNSTSSIWTFQGMGSFDVYIEPGSPINFHTSCQNTSGYSIYANLKGHLINE